MSKALIFSGFTLLLLCLSCGAPPSEVPERPSGDVPESETRDLLREAITSLNRGDIGTALENLKADFHYLPPGSVRFSTAHNFREALEDLLENNRIEISFSTESVSEDELVAATRHRFVATLSGAGGSRVVNGTALIVFEREQPNQEWQVAQLIWNGNMQMPAPPQSD